MASLTPGQGMTCAYDPAKRVIKNPVSPKKLPNYMKNLKSHVPVPTIPRVVNRAPEPFEPMPVNEFTWTNDTRKIHYPMMLKKYEIDKIDDRDMDDFRYALSLIVKKKDNNELFDRHLKNEPTED